MTASISGGGLGFPSLQGQDPKQRERRDLIPRRCRDAVGSRQRVVARPASRPATLVPAPAPGGGSAALRARRRRGRAGPVAHTPRSPRRPRSRTCTPPTCQPHRRTSSTGSCRTSFAARWRIGIATACPSVINRAKPSISRSSGCGSGGSGGRARTARQISRRTSAPPRWSAVTAALHAVR